jgi:hypothetical protein
MARQKSTDRTTQMTLVWVLPTKRRCDTGRGRAESPHATGKDKDGPRKLTGDESVSSALEGEDSG